MVRRAKCMVSNLVSAMLSIGQKEQWLIEEDLFGFRLADPMLVITLSSIACVPVEAGNLAPVNHLLYIAKIYR